MIRNNFWTDRARKLFLGIAIFFGLLITLFAVQATTAQNSLGAWAEPENLSQSGGTINPVIVVDTTGMNHVIWQDDLIEDVVYYTKGNEETWEPARQIDFPFGTNKPQLLASSDGTIHALWIVVGEYGDTELYYSQVNSEQFDNPLAWVAPLIIDESATAFHAAIDDTGIFHLVYTRSETPNGLAGVYYRRRTDGQVWGEIIPLLQSQYFRALTPQESHIRLATSSTGDSTHLYVAWDNYPQKRVSYTYSQDGGTTWTTPIDIDSLDEKLADATPFNIFVQARENQVLLTWQFGDEISCDIYSQSSSNSGESWSESQRVVMGDNNTCPQINQLLKAKEGILLLTTIDEQSVLIAWDGSQWSENNDDTTISPFIDIGTYEVVTLNDLQATFSTPERIWLVGLDIGSGGDIWATYQDLPAFSTWFDTGSLWSTGEVITSVDERLSKVTLIADQTDTMHAFWSQTEIIEVAEGESEEEQVQDNAIPSKVIYHASRRGGYWNQPTAILRSPTGDAGSPVVQIDSTGRLFAFWSGTSNEGIYYSWANAQGADNPLEWEMVEVVPNTAQSGSNFDVIIDTENVISLIYAISFNEERGVYLEQSFDDGQTWSQPFQVFDGAQAGWDMVAQPTLSFTDDGNLQALWLRYSLPTDISKALGAYTSFSSNGGQVWSLEQALLENQTTQAELIAQGEPISHAFMLETSNITKDGTSTMWHAISDNGGETWGELSNLWSLRSNQVPLTIVMDRAGQVYLLNMAQDRENITLQYLYWDGARWFTEESVSFPRKQNETITAMSAAVSSDGILGNIFASELPSAPDQTTKSNLIFTQREVSIPEEKPTRQPTVSPTAPIDNIPTETPQSQPTPTYDLQTFNTNTSNNSQLSSIMGIGLGSILAILIIAGVVFVSLMRRR